MSIYRERMRAVRLPFEDSLSTRRDILVQRWLKLTNEILVSMAVKKKWPVSQNHCFMRICLDASLGGPWHLVVKRPAVRYLTIAQLQNAIAVAENIVASPALLFALNRASIERRTRKSVRDSTA